MEAKIPNNREKLLITFNRGSDLKSLLVRDALANNRSLNKQIITILENYFLQKGSGK